MKNKTELRKYYPELPVREDFDLLIMKEQVELVSLDFLFNSRYADRLSFIGGTNLRLVEGIDRFSEDLDFDCKGLDKNQFIEMTDELVRHLNSLGFPAVPAEQESDRLSAFRRSIRFPGFAYEQGLSPYKGKRFLLKIEAQDQEYLYPRISRTIEKQGTAISVKTPPLTTLIAMKTAATLNRAKGRDFYDLDFLLGKTPLDFKYLDIKLGIKNTESLRSRLIAKINETDMKLKVEDVKHLLINPENAEKILGLKNRIIAIPDSSLGERKKGIKL